MTADDTLPRNPPELVSLALRVLQRPRNRLQCTANILEGIKNEYSKFLGFSARSDVKTYFRNVLFTGRGTAEE